ncbi:MAG: polysaccharide deacetylase family protein [Calditrichia bacterium]
MNADLLDIPVLTYHKIEQRREWGLNTLPPARFYQQMKLLKEMAFTPVTFQQLLQGNLPQNPVIITFDDGYESVYTHALPVLQEFGFPAVVFVITGFLGRWNEWDANLGGIRFRHLNAEQIRQLAAAGMEIASHGETHRPFSRLSPSELENELGKSRSLLQEMTGQPVLSLAFPFGMSGRDLHRKAAEHGYCFACGSIWQKPSADELLYFPRIPVYRSDSLRAFRNKLAEGWRNRLERAKLHIICWPARLTPLYQKLKNSANST